MPRYKLHLLFIVLVLLSAPCTETESSCLWNACGDFSDDKLNKYSITVFLPQTLIMKNVWYVIYVTISYRPSMVLKSSKGQKTSCGQLSWGIYRGTSFLNKDYIKIPLCVSPLCHRHCIWKLRFSFLRKWNLFQNRKQSLLTWMNNKKTF